MKIVKGFFLALFLFGFSQGSVLAADPPDVTVKKATNEILGVIRKNKKLYEKDSAALYKMVKTQLSPYFDFQTMSKLVLGKNWRTASSAQRSEFADAFRDLLVRTYAKVILRYTDEKIDYLPFRSNPTDKKATVKTKVISKTGAPDIPINYSFFNKNNVWKVFDVSVEGISLVNNYRSVYREKVEKQGLASVIKMIQQDPGQTEADKKKNK